MEGIERRAFLTAFVALCSRCAGQAADEHSPHDPSAVPGAGLKKELIAGIDEADFCRLGSKPKVVKVLLAATFTEANHGMNFNGWSHGDACYTVPAGWTVEVTFINPSPVPHSVIVVERDVLKRPQMGAPAFDGASTKDPVFGLSLGKSAFSFVADEPGQYAFACGIPTHASAGHWAALEVKSQATAPTLQVNGGPVRQAK